MEFGRVTGVLYTKPKGIMKSRYINTLEIHELDGLRLVVICKDHVGMMFSHIPIAITQALYFINQNAKERLRCILRVTVNIF